MTVQIATVIIALTVAALTLLPVAGWTERICAAAMLLPTAIGLFDHAPVVAALTFQPSLPLRITLELGCLLLLLHAAFSADRWFPLVMAAAALIGIAARALAFSGLGGPDLAMLQMSALPLLLMASTLCVSMAVKAASRLLSNASA